MCGFYARADSSKPVRVDLDNELADAQWYTREDILQILGHSEGTKLDYKKITEMEKKELLGKKDNKDMPSVWTENDDEKAKKEEEKKKEAGEGEPPFRVPPTTAIAGVLIRDWATGRVQFPPVEVGQSVGVANL